MKRFLAAVTAIIMILSLVIVPIAAEGVETSKVVPAPSVKTEIVYDFETDPLAAGWTLQDQDGDGTNWRWMYDPGAGYNIPEGLGYMESQSYINGWGPGTGALTPDNWLISPVVENCGEKVSFMFAAEDASCPDEPIGVYVSTDGGETWGEELGYFVATAEVQTIEVNLSAFAGQSIQVAFRHYNVTDQYSVNLDMVKISQGSEEPPAEAYLHGFVLGNNDPDDVAFMWAGFSSTAPETLTEETMMNDIPTAGAYAGGKVYGFLNFGNFYAMDAETFEVDYGGIGTDKMVYSMAYDHSAGVMYAIAMDMWNGPAIFTVDLALGSLEYAAPLNVGVDEDDFPIMLYTLAIDGEGNAYGLAPGDDAALYSIDLETGEGELIGNTGLPLAFMQSMTWDHNTDKLFWAQYGGDDNDDNGLYIIDPVTCETTRCGRIGGGAEIVALWIANDEPIAPIVIPDFNITFIDGLTNEEIPGGYDVPAGTVLNEADFPAPPEHTDYNFLGWDYEGEPVYHDTVVTAKYRNIHAIGFYFETDPEPDGWYWEDHDGDGYDWLWTGSEPDGYFNIPEGEGCMVSYSFAPDNYSALTPDNWLISPVVPGGGNVSFMFTAMYPAYAGEVIGVYASTDGGDTWSDELGYFEATGEIQTPVVDLSQYADQNVQLAFRHYNCTDLLCVSLDAVEVIPGEAIAPPTEEPPTENPTEPPAPPTTGFVSLAGVGIAAVLAGAGIVLFRRKRS